MCVNASAECAMAAEVSSVRLNREVAICSCCVQAFLSTSVSTDEQGDEIPAKGNTDTHICHHGQPNRDLLTVVAGSNTNTLEMELKCAQTHIQLTLCTMNII